MKSKPSVEILFWILARVKPPSEIIARRRRNLVHYMGC
jgi:hypothetical protein